MHDWRQVTWEGKRVARGKGGGLKTERKTVKKRGIEAGPQELLISGTESIRGKRTVHQICALAP
jgi:hypothetical protein